MYVSTSTGPPNANMMDEIMKVAQAHNSSAGITGFLISRNFTFVQFVEGPPEALDSPMESIRNDGRHHSIEVLIDEPATSRRFPKWSMTYRLLAPGSANPYGNVSSNVDDTIDTRDYAVIYEAAEKVSQWLVGSAT